MGTGACEAETRSVCAGPQQAYVIAGKLTETTVTLCTRHMQDIARRGYSCRVAPARVGEDVGKDVDVGEKKSEVPRADDGAHVPKLGNGD
jgi:hypothetical protein